jgi:NAD-dependent SIR2 family protein deacetylase
MISGKRLQRLYEHSRLNRQFMVPGSTCRCFHCLRTFEAEQINRWTDDGETAVCPCCGVDSVLSGSADHLTDELIRGLQANYFLGPSKKFTADEWRNALAREQPAKTRPRVAGAR